MNQTVQMRMMRILVSVHFRRSFDDTEWVVKLVVGVLEPKTRGV